MVWYGMVWYGMVWYGMVWHDMCGLLVPEYEPHTHAATRVISLAPNLWVLFRMVWDLYGMVLCGMVWCDMVRYGMAWYVCYTCTVPTPPTRTAQASPHRWSPPGPTCGPRSNVWHGMGMVWYVVWYGMVSPGMSGVRVRSCISRAHASRRRAPAPHRAGGLPLA